MKGGKLCELMGKLAVNVASMFGSIAKLGFLTNSLIKFLTMSFVPALRSNWFMMSPAPPSAVGFILARSEAGFDMNCDSGSWRVWVGIPDWPDTLGAIDDGGATLDINCASGSWDRLEGDCKLVEFGGG